MYLQNRNLSILLLLLISYCLLLSLGLFVSGVEWTNVALHKPAKFSGEDLGGGEASRVVDGDTSFIWTDRTCITTVNETDNWFVVDLLFTYDVFDFRIANRRHMKENLANFSVYVSMENPLPLPGSPEMFAGELCLNVTEEQPKGLSSHQCYNIIPGRYVYLWKPTNGQLALCEFEIQVEQESMMKWRLNRNPGYRSKLYPVYQKIMRNKPSPIRCFIICTEEMDSMPSHVQIDNKTGECQCLVYSPLSGLPHAYVADADYDLYHLVSEM